MWYSFENFSLIRKYSYRFHSPCTSSCTSASDVYGLCTVYISLLFFVYQMPPFTYGCVYIHAYRFIVCAVRYIACFLDTIASIFRVFLYIRGRFYLAFLLTVFFFLLDYVHICSVHLRLRSSATVFWPSPLLIKPNTWPTFTGVSLYFSILF